MSNVRDEVNLDERDFSNFGDAPFESRAGHAEGMPIVMLMVKGVLDFLTMHPRG